MEGFSPFSIDLQPLTIKKINADLLEKKYRRNNPQDKKITDISLMHFMVNEYKDEKKKPLFKHLDNFPGTAWSQIDSKKFSILGYYCPIPIQSPIASMLDKLQMDIGEKQVDISYLFVLYRVHKKAREIFALCSGSRGYLPVHDFSDFSFPRQVALRLLDPQKRSKEASKRIIGSVLSSQEVLRGEGVFDFEKLLKVVTNFTAALRSDASIHAIKYLRTTQGKVPTKPVEFEIQEGGVRIHKKLPMEAFPPILDHFATIIREEATYLYPGTRQKRKRENDAEEAFEFLTYFVPVFGEQYFRLEAILYKRLAEAIKKEEVGAWEVCPSHAAEYYQATEFRLRCKSSNPYDLDWEGYRLSFSQLIDKLRQFPQLQKGKELLIKELSHVYLGFRTKGVWKEFPITTCIMGQLKYQDESGRNRSYFKLEKKWYELSKDLLHRVDIEFRRCMAETLLFPSDPGYLPHSWEPKGSDLTEAAIKKKLGVLELPRKSVTYVDEKGKVLEKKLMGEILENLWIHEKKSEIETCLQKNEVDQDDFKKEFGQEKGRRIWEELTKKREVFTKKTSGKKTALEVHNPFFPGATKKQKELLRRWDFDRRCGRDEGAYNEGYLYDRQPYTLDQNGWLVGDRICPDNIEIFDLLHWTNDQVFVIHVKESFGQKTRDACSQLMNSSRVIAHALKNNKTETILDRFFEEATKKSNDLSPYRAKVRKQLMALKKGGFNSLFQTREIVFVYAFVDSRVGVHEITKKSVQKRNFSLSDFETDKTQNVARNIFQELKRQNYLKENGDRGEKFYQLHSVKQLTFEDPTLLQYQEFTWRVLTGDLVFFQSLIGRMDVIHTRSQIEALGFKFRVCQIKRSGQEEVPMVCPSILTGSFQDETSLMEDVASSDVVFYLTPWSDEQECYQKKKTKGDGSCAIHALLGEELNGEIACANPQEVREELAQALGQLDQDADLKGLYESNMISLIDEAMQSGRSHLIQSAKLIFSDLPAFNQYQIQCGSAARLKIIKTAIQDSRVKARGKIVEILFKEAKSQGKREDFLEKLKNDDEFLDHTFCLALGKLNTFSKNSKTFEWLNKPLKDLKELRGEQDEAKKTLMQDQSVRDKYLTCLKDKAYWLTSDELQMLAHIRNIRVEIIVEDGGDYGCNNQDRLKPRNGEEPVVIHANGSHYSRCELYG